MVNIYFCLGYGEEQRCTRGEMPVNEVNSTRKISASEFHAKITSSLRF